MIVANEKVTRYTVDSKDRVRKWECWFGTNSEGTWGIFYCDGLADGKMKDPTFKEAKEKNVGKANYMSCEMQAQAMVIQQVGKKERSNYFETPELARSNKLWLPMLCPSGMKWKEYKEKKTTGIFYPAYASDKFDGARCNVFLKDDEVYSQTRTGKEWFNNRHIEEALEEVFAEYPELIFDGELYNHDYRDNFEDLMSIIKKGKPTDEQREFAADNVEYHIYDVYDINDPDKIFEDRQAILEHIFAEFDLDDFLIHAKSVIVRNEEEFDHFHSTALKIGYEGSILRLNLPYDVDKRSKALLKRKELYDCEFVVDEICEGEGTHKGLGSHMYISLNTVSGMNSMDEAKIDKTVRQKAAPGKGWDHDMLKRLFEQKDELIGKTVTVEYFEITGHGALRFPKFKAIRDYE